MSHTITLSGRQLRDLLSPVLPLADKDGFLPVLHAVLLRGHREWLTATATDRYRVGVQRVRVEAPEGWSVVVPLDVIKTLLATYKPTRAVDPELTLTFDEPHSFTVESGSLGLAVESSRIGYRLLTAEYPKVNSIIREALSGHPIKPGTGVSPHLLADFAKASHGEPMNLFSGKSRTEDDTPRGPIGISIGDDFRGAIMPVRAAKAEALPDSWLALLDGTAKVEEKAS